MVAIYTLACVVLACNTRASVMYARALVSMHACRMSHARNLSASHSHSLVKLHVSCTVYTLLSGLASDLSGKLQSSVIELLESLVITR